MKYYYPVELPCYTKIQEFAIEDIKKKLHNTFFSEQVRIKHNISGNLLNTINNDLYNLGLPKLSYAQSYIRRKNTKQGIHVDGDSELISLAINIPLSGTIGSKFNWYDGEYELIKTNVRDIIFYSVVWKGEPICVESLEITKPYLIRVDKPHSAESNINEDRWIFTMRFEHNPKDHILLC